MSKSKLDEGVIQALLERLNKQRLPRLLSLKKQVDRGEALSDYDLEFLTEVMTDATKVGPLLERNPEYSTLVSHVISLYSEISEKALQIEKSK